MEWPFRRDESVPDPRDEGPVLIHALDGFLTAGSAPRLAAEQLLSGSGELVHRFAIDDFFDYRARRPEIRFQGDHYLDYAQPRLDVVRETDASGVPFLVLVGPEPDYRWESFAAELADVVRAEGVSVTIGLGAVPMGVPHTRPLMITTHATRPELVDRTNIWQADVRVPSSAQALLEYRFAEWQLDAVGYVVHVPHYLAQIEFPQAAVALLEAVVDRTGLGFDLEPLRTAQGETLASIAAQIHDQEGESVLSGLEEQYDAFTRGAAQSLLAEENAIPTGDELADQFEAFLARQRKDDPGT